MTVTIQITKGTINDETHAAITPFSHDVTLLVGRVSLTAIVSLCFMPGECVGIVTKKFRSARKFRPKPTNCLIWTVTKLTSAQCTPIMAPVTKTPSRGSTLSQVAHPSPPTTRFTPCVCHIDSVLWATPTLWTFGRSAKLSGRCGILQKTRARSPIHVNSR
jgi:hypothetical protein